MPNDLLRSRHLLRLIFAFCCGVWRGLVGGWMVPSGAGEGEGGREGGRGFETAG